jgi:hypothetical protein
MATQNFDQLNNLRKYGEIWYSDSNMPEQAKKKRLELYMDYTELMLLLFYMINEQQLESNEYEAFLEERLRIIAENYIGTDDLAYINDWSKKQAKKIIDDTNNLFEGELEDETAEKEEAEKAQKQKVKQEEKELAKSGDKEAEEKPKKEKETIHFEEFDVDIPKDEYPTSDFRACLIAVECVTAVANYDDYYQAYKDGRHKKVWQCSFKKSSRETHKEAHGQQTDIDKPFYIGDSIMAFPGDITNNPDMKEIYGCECWCEYY